MSNFNPITVRMVGKQQVDRIKQLADNLPINADLECVFRKIQKVRGLDANARMWAGPLKDIATQAWVNGRQFSAEVWHEHFKREYLPEDDDPEWHGLVKDGYRKWDYTPAGARVLVGSTSQLTKKGFARYLQQIEADGANMGVMFSAAPNADDRMMAGATLADKALAYPETYGECA